MLSFLTIKRIFIWFLLHLNAVSNKQYSLFYHQKLCFFRAIRMYSCVKDLRTNCITTTRQILCNTLKMTNCFICHNVLSDNEYSFSSLVSSNNSVQQIFFNVIKDIGLEIGRNNCKVLTDLRNLDNPENVPICALCFKRFCDYERFSLGLKDLQTSFKEDIETKVRIDFSSPQQALPTNNAAKNKNKEGGKKIDLDPQRRLSNRHRKAPSRFAMKRDQNTKLFDRSCTENYSNNISHASIEAMDKEVIEELKSRTDLERKNSKDFTQKTTTSEGNEKCKSGEKPFQCSICEKLFTRKASMQEHLERHQGIMIFNIFVMNARMIFKSKATQFLYIP